MPEIELDLSLYKVKEQSSSAVKKRVEKKRSSSLSHGACMVLFVIGTNLEEFLKHMAYL